jgi:hypothetical protein
MIHQALEFLVIIYSTPVENRPSPFAFLRYWLQLLLEFSIDLERPIVGSIPS